MSELTLQFYPQLCGTFYVLSAHCFGFIKCECTVLIHSHSCIHSHSACLFYITNSPVMSDPPHALLPCNNPSFPTSQSPASHPAHPLTCSLISPQYLILLLCFPAFLACFWPPVRFWILLLPAPFAWFIWFISLDLSCDTQQQFLFCFFPLFRNVTAHVELTSRKPDRSRMSYTCLRTLLEGT